jgi:flavin reductase (DIM6/NTAB) family NADH-FMN oxidoreductase RutF
MKIHTKPQTALYPLPAILVSMGKFPVEYNIITISWTGTICSDPPMCYISVRPERYSYSILERNMEFVINLTNQNLLYAADWCGIKSGRDFDKFKEMGLTPVRAQKIAAPIIEEAPVNIECMVEKIIPLGSHHMFMAKVVAVSFSEQHFDTKKEGFLPGNSNLLAYAFKQYYNLGIAQGTFGFSGKK